MAIISTIHCRVCKQFKDVCHSVAYHPDMCSECKENQKEAAKNKHLSERAALPIEDRLLLLEGELYDMRHAPKPFDRHTPIG